MTMNMPMLMASNKYVAGVACDATLIPAGSAREPADGGRGSAGSWDRHVLQNGEASPKVNDGNSAPHWRQVGN
jgi:hypothetical protein